MKKAERSVNHVVLESFDAIAKGYGLTLDEFLDKVLAGKIQVKRDGSKMEFGPLVEQEQEPAMSLSV